MKAVDVSPPDVTLEWIAPTDTGNCPLSAYVIETRRHDDVSEPEKFREVAVVDGDTLKYTVTSLAMNESHDFRVTARNEAGDGESCEAETPTFVKKPVGQSASVSAPASLRSKF